MCGKQTFRIINSDIQSRVDLEELGWVTDSSDVIWWQNNPIKINWPSDKVHTFKDLDFHTP